MAKITFPASPLTVPALDSELRGKAQAAKAKHSEFVAGNRKARTEGNPDAQNYDGGFDHDHPNSGIVTTFQQQQADLSISLENAKKARKR